MKIIEIEQGSKPWLNLRKTKITSTDAAIILGISEYCTPYTLWQRKLDLIPEQEVNDAMRKGSELEPEALKAFIEHYGMDMKPAVVMSEKYPWMMTSLDGISRCGLHAVEIKCSKKIYENALKGVVDPIYYTQCQHHMICCNLQEIMFGAYWDGKIIYFPVFRDDKYCINLIEQEKWFWDCLNTFTPVPMAHKDYQTIDNDEWKQLTNIYLEAKDKADYWKNISEATKDQLIKMTNGQSSIGAGIKLSKYPVKGRVDHKKMIDDYHIDENSYRKPSTINWRISEC